VGVLDIHADISKALDIGGVKITAVVSDPKKVERAPFTALTDDARAHMQAGVDAWYGDFLSAVKRGRGARAVASGNFGGGRMLDSRTAWSLGMVDFISGGGL
jgi:ClpP class serine protease